MSIQLSSKHSTQPRDDALPVSPSLTHRPHSDSAETVFAHPDVALTERKIWSLLYPKIASFVEISGFPTHILEIGGGTGHGAQMIRSTWGAERVGISVVDKIISRGIKDETSPGVRWYQEDIYSVTQGMMSALPDLVIAARTFEYDPNYMESLQHVRTLCSNNARVILVHNAEDSSALHSVSRFSSRLEYLQEINRICIDAIESKGINYEQRYRGTISALRAKFGVIDRGDESAHIEYHLSRAEQFGSDAAISFLNKGISLHQHTRNSIQDVYGDRIDQRRFWFSTSSEAHEFYKSIGYTLLSRSNSKETSSRLSVLVDELMAW